MTANLDALADRFWLAYSEYLPTIATVRGEHRFDDQLPTYTDDWLGRIAGEFDDIESHARAIDSSGLDMQNRINRDLLIQEAAVWANEIRDRFLVVAIDPYLGPHTRLLSDTQQNTVHDTGRAEALLERYSKVGAYLASALDLIRDNCAAGMTPPRASLKRVLGQLDGYLASSPDTDPFLKLVLSDASDQAAWSERAGRLVEEVIKPGSAPTSTSRASTTSCSSAGP